jgi:hypothetical protein
MKDYCVQNDGDCSTCSLVNYGKDCQNNPVTESLPELEPAVNDVSREIAEAVYPRCSTCASYYEYQLHGVVKRRCSATKPSTMVPKDMKEAAPLWCPLRA